MSDRELTERQHREQGYREYTITAAALRIMAEAGSDLVLKRGGTGAFTITDTEDSDWLDGLSITDVEPES